MSTSKTRILDAAERVVLRNGAGHLTLEAVAAETPLSKGGLLYHFGSKEDLIRGMIDRLIDEFDAAMARYREADPNPTGRNTRALLHALVEREPEEPQHLDCVCASLLAALATDPNLLAPVQDRFAAWQKLLLEDGIDPVVAMIVGLAADGMWLNRMLNFPEPDQEWRDQILSRLRSLTEGS